MCHAQVYKQRETSRINQVIQVENTACLSICIFSALTTGHVRAAWPPRSTRARPFFPSPAPDKFTRIDRKRSLFLCSISLLLIRLAPLPKRITEITLINFPANLPVSRLVQAPGGETARRLARTEKRARQERDNEGLVYADPPTARTLLLRPFLCAAPVLLPTLPRRLLCT